MLEYRTELDGTEILLVPSGNHGLVYEFGKYGEGKSDAECPAPPSFWICRGCQQIGSFGGILRVKDGRFENKPEDLTHVCQPVPRMKEEYEEDDVMPEDETKTERSLAECLPVSVQKHEPNQTTNEEPSEFLAMSTSGGSESDVEIEHSSPAVQTKGKGSSKRSASVDTSAATVVIDRKKPVNHSRGDRRYKDLSECKSAIEYVPLTPIDLEVIPGLLQDWRNEISKQFKEYCDDRACRLRLKQKIMRRYNSRSGNFAIYDLIFRLMTTKTSVQKLLNGESRLVVEFAVKVLDRISRSRDLEAAPDDPINVTSRSCTIRKQQGTAMTDEQKRVYMASLLRFKQALEPHLNDMKRKDLAARLRKMFIDDASRTRLVDMACNLLVSHSPTPGDIIRESPEVDVLCVLRGLGRFKLHLAGQDVDDKMMMPDFGVKTEGATAVHGLKVRKSGSGTKNLIAARKIGKSREAAAKKGRAAASVPKPEPRTALTQIERRQLIQFVRNLTSEGYSVPKSFIRGFVNKVLNNPTGVDDKWIEALLKSARIDVKSSAEFEAIGTNMFH